MEEGRSGAFGRLWRNPHYRYGVAAQFFNVAAQVCAWSFTIQYAQDVVGISKGSAGFYLQASLIVFLISRFVMTYLLGIFRPTKLLFAMGALGVVLCLTAVLAQNMLGLIAVVGISVSLSLMFPTIYGVALQGLGPDTKFGAAGLVMAILGGAIMPLVMGKVMDQYGTAEGFIVPGDLPGLRRAATRCSTSAPSGTAARSWPRERTDGRSVRGQRPTAAPGVRRRGATWSWRTRRSTATSSSEAIRDRAAAGAERVLARRAGDAREGPRGQDDADAAHAGHGRPAVDDRHAARRRAGWRRRSSRRRSAGWPPRAPRPTARSATPTP